MLTDTIKKYEDLIIRTMLSVHGVVRVSRIPDDDRREILALEEEAEKRSLMGLGKVLNVGVREVLKDDLVYVALTDMAFDWGCHATLVLKKGDAVVGEEVRDATAIAKLSNQKNVWFMHRNFVIYKDKISFPQDIVKKICHFEIPCLPADWCVLQTDGQDALRLNYSAPSTLCDTYLKERYFDNRAEHGLGTILLGVHFRR
jgi:hypothetical protein